MLTRRKFGELCAGLGSSLPVARRQLMALSGASALSGSVAMAATDAKRTVKFRDGAIVPALGQGSWHLGDGRRPPAEEEEALRTGISLGMTLIDTAEVYAADHGSERLIGRAIAGQRDRVFLVSKVWPTHVAKDGVERACEASLKRLGTDHLDLYLLHWPNDVTDIAHVVRSFESLRSAGKIRAWGVSNFKVSDMENLFRVPQGDRCATNQLPYSLNDRSIERDLLPSLACRAVRTMAAGRVQCCGRRGCKGPDWSRSDPQMEYGADLPFGGL